ncbi:hypothetical protein GW756_05050 [bacterium]|nr:hypothetical protein [bacterium]NCQ55745.1 hypothetical protein [Candidatus Parcubacteria bacterium]NCS67694.1 hypothetical protein [Candidatus Peregrinibacteria bacterium]NCS96708.1 hypothetical protein [bacterium]
MSITPITSNLVELLQRNLFLQPQLKAKILDATPEKQAEILPLLTEIDGKQTDLFKKVLKTNPNFFADLENMAIHEALKKLVEAEEVYRLKEMTDAEAELTQKLNQL